MQKTETKIFDFDRTDDDNNNQYFDEKRIREQKGRENSHITSSNRYEQKQTEKLRSEKHDANILIYLDFSHRWEFRRSASALILNSIN